MRYNFSSIYDEKMLSGTQVLFIFGKYNVFNNIVVDRFRNRCKGIFSSEETAELEALAAEFGGKGSVGGQMALSIEEFKRQIHMPCSNGLWFCSVRADYTSDKDMDWIKEYMKNPSRYGVLIVICSDWKKIKQYRKLSIFKTSEKTSCIQLGFPDRQTLKEIIKLMFKEKLAELDDRAVELFIMRMSSSYDEYPEVVDTVVDRAGIYEKSQLTKISYEDMKEYMHGIENYLLDDFIDRLSAGMTSKKVVKTRKIYKVMDSLVDELGYSGLVYRLKYRIRDLLEFRIAINNGIIPILVRYDAKLVKSQLSDDSSIKRISDRPFKRGAHTASKFSLRELYYMKLMLEKITPLSSEDECMRVVLDIIHRKAYSANRLTNDIGVADVLDENMYKLNSILYNENLGLKRISQ